MNQKEIKLLWGRAANRCAMCRVELTQDAKAHDAAFVLGEQAHIVGEKEEAARGKSALTEEERNSYHNIILLCPTHHTEIDKNAADWPVEKLHLTKSKHELWVRETLGDASDIKLLAKQVTVTSIIDAAVELCRLEEWKEWTSCALAPDPYWKSDLPDMIFEFRQRVAAAIWPSEFEELRRATTTFAILLHDAASTFMEHSDKDGGIYWTHKFYKAGGFNPNYDQDLQRYDAWLDECFKSIKEATRAANWFADVVRRDINPMFFVERGKFVIVEGPFTDLTYHASVLEFTHDRKTELPDTLHKKVGD
jgi:hypothetical protein